MEQNKHIKRLKKQLINQFKQNREAVGTQIDWDKVYTILTESKGIPQPVLATVEADTLLNQKIPLVKRPDRLYGIPQVTPLLQDSWSVLVATFSRREKAVDLAAMFNHQGPQIPSRVVEIGQNYRVVAGPFENKKQAYKIVQRIKRDFEIDALVKKVKL